MHAEVARLDAVVAGPRKLARVIFLAMGRWQARLEKKQVFLGRIVDVGAELSKEHPERADEASELADLFCRQARRRVHSHFGALWSNDDDRDYRAAQRLLEGRYAWIDEGIVDPSGEGALIAEQPESVRS